MRTTLDLPEDVGRILREESARRGGRGRAPITQLVAEAVLARFGSQPKRTSRKTGKKGGIPIVRRVHPGEVLDQKAIERALAEMP